MSGTHHGCLLAAKRTLILKYLNKSGQTERLYAEVCDCAWVRGGHRKGTSSKYQARLLIHVSWVLVLRVNELCDGYT